MITKSYANLAQSLLIASPASGSLSLSLTAWYGSLFPTTYPYTIKVEEFNSSNQVTKREIMSVTNNASDILTVTRAVEACPASYLATTQTTTAYSFLITWGYSTVVTLINSAKDMTDLKNDLNLKLASVWWLRTGMWSALGVNEIDVSWNEVKRLITAWATILSTETLNAYDPSTRAVKSVPYSFIENSISQWWAQDSVAWEAITVNDACMYEQIFASIPVFNSWIWKYLQIKMWDLAATTRRSTNIIGNGVSASTLKLWLAKVGAPTDNLTVRIETNNAWNPSGTLAHANATWNIAWTWLTTTVVDTTVTFAWAFTLTDNTLYHIVIQRVNAVDPANYYIIWGVSRNVRFLKVNSYNASWGTASATTSIYFSYTWAYSKYVVKAISNLVELNWFDWIAVSTVAIWALVKLNREWLMSWFTWLTNWASYYLTTTAWALTSTATATNREVWYAVGTTKMYIKSPLYNPSNMEYFNDTSYLTLYSEWAVNGSNLVTTLRVNHRCRIGAWMTFSWGNGTLNVYINHTIARTIGSNSIPLVFHDVYPWDIVTINYIVWAGSFWRNLAINTLTAPLVRFE